MAKLGAFWVVRLPMLGSRGGANAPTTLTAKRQNSARVKGKVTTKKARVFPPRAAVLAEITYGLGATSTFDKTFNQGAEKNLDEAGFQ